MSEAKPIGLAAFLATVIMLFTAFTASMLIRRTSPDWQPIALPTLLWVNTAFLAAGSASIERARRSRAPETWIVVTMFFGLLFLIGQIVAWADMAANGLLSRSNPHASFFCLLTTVHGLHFLGGLVALGWAWARPSRVGACAVYWHFMGGVWIYLLILLSVM